MPRFNLADRESSTLIYATDSLEDMVAFVSTMLAEDGNEALDGLSLSMQRERSSRVDSFADEAMVEALHSYQHHAGPTRRPA